MSGYRTYLLMILATAFWGGSFVAGKIALRESSPMMLLFLRLLIATIVIFPILFKSEKRPFPQTSDALLLFGLGMLGVSLFFILQFYALLFTTASNASIINALNPLLSSFLASYLVEEKLTKVKLALISLAFFGVILTIIKGNLVALIDMNFDRGSLIMLFATISFSFYSVISKKATRKYSPKLVTSYMLLFGLLQVTPFMLFEGVFLEIFSYSYVTWLCIGFMAVFSSVIGYLIQQNTIKEIGVNKTVLFNNLVTPFAMFFAFLILDESISSINILSALIILTAVLVNSKLE